MKFLILGLSFIFLMTIIGGLPILVMNKKTFKSNTLMSLSAGIMLAASFFSLILPSIEKSQELNMGFLPPVLGFSLGFIFLLICDYILGRKNKKISKGKKLFYAMTIHNIPEGFSVGIAIAFAINSGKIEFVWEALMLAFAIGIQNIPEGLAVAIPLKLENNSKWKCYFYTIISAIVEPLSGIIAFLLFNVSNLILPFALSFGAGAMIYAIIKEILPNIEKNSDALFFMIGFLIMMILDTIF